MQPLLNICTHPDEPEIIAKTFTAILVFVLVATCPAPLPAEAAAGRINIKYARGFSVRRLGRATLVTVSPSWNKGAPARQYLLVPRGRPVPAGHPRARVIRVPVRRLVSLSTTQLAYLDAAGLTGTLVAVSDFRYVNTASVRRLIDSGRLRQVGHSLNLRIEAIMDLEPDLILATAGGTAFDVHPKLEEAGLPVVIMSDHLESHPLGRCEWIKFMALFFGTEDQAGELFRRTEARYLGLAALAAKAEKRPAVLVNAPFGGQWWVPGGRSFFARYITDAGGNYLWSADRHTGSLPLDVEAVFEKGAGADVWINTGAWKKISDALAVDPRLAQVKALRQGRVFNNNRRLNRWGGNDFWESGIIRPDRILADLIRIFHPRLLPGRKLYYYRRLETGKQP